MLYENIVRRCKDKRMPISELEKSAGLGNATIQKWRTAIPKVDSLQRVAAILGVTIDELLKE